MMWQLHIRENPLIWRTARWGEPRGNHWQSYGRPSSYETAMLFMRQNANRRIYDWRLVNLETGAVEGLWLVGGSE